MEEMNPVSSKIVGLDYFKKHIKEPTGAQCEGKEKLFESASKTLYACWYPQMGAYVGKAVAIFDKSWKMHKFSTFIKDTLGVKHGLSNTDGNLAEGGCIDILVWHDGRFPFSNSEPRVLHHCDPSQFIAFGEFLQGINDANMVKV